MPEVRNQQPACSRNVLNHRLYNEVRKMLRPAHILWVILALQTGSAAPVEMSSGVFRGQFESSQGTATSGQITARSADGSSYFCGYDSRSYFEMDKERIMAAKLATKLMPGDPVMIVADRRPGSRACYTRILHVLPPAPPPRRPSAPPAKPKYEIQPMRGDRTFSGIVARLDAGRITLKTRDGEETLMVRPDTRFLEGGSRSTASALPVNAHVFVRAGQNLDGVLEAYQVMWGDILTVR